MESNEKHSDIREKLKGLKHVKTSDDFMHKLHNKIATIETEKGRYGRRTLKNRISFFQLLQNPWLIPSAAIVLLSFIILYYSYITNKNTNVTQSPVSTQSTEQSNDNLSQKYQPEEKLPDVTSVPMEKPNDNSKNLAGREYTDNLKNSNKEKTSLPEKENATTEERENIKGYEESSFIKRDKDQEPDNSLTNQKTKVQDKKELKNESENGIKMQQEGSVPSSPDLSLKPNGIIDTNILKTKSPSDKINTLDKKTLEKLRDKVNSN